MALCVCGDGGKAELSLPPPAQLPLPSSGDSSTEGGTEWAACTGADPDGAEGAEGEPMARITDDTLSTWPGVLLPPPAELAGVPLPLGNTDPLDEVGVLLVLLWPLLGMLGLRAPMLFTTFHAFRSGDCKAGDMPWCCCCC